MKTPYLRDQRGVAMLLELLLVAAVLGLVGVAVYQSNHRTDPTAATVAKPAAASSATSLAASAAANVVAESVTDATLSAEAEATADEVAQADSDTANLGGSYDANSF